MNDDGELEGAGAPLNLKGRTGTHNEISLCRRRARSAAELSCFAWSRSAAQKPFRAEIFVEFRPVDAVPAAGNFPVGSLRRVGI